MECSPGLVLSLVLVIFVNDLLLDLSVSSCTLICKSAVTRHEKKMVLFWCLPQKRREVA